VKTVDVIYRYRADAPARSRPSGSEEALLRLDEGNRTFAALLDQIKDEFGRTERVVPVDARDLGLISGEVGMPSQHPFAAVLGCSDARVPIELIFNEGPNDLFVVRVAGNVLGTDVLGSLKFAVEHLGGSLKLIVVLGHSGCGAVASAVDVFLDPGDYVSLATKHSLRNILDRLLVIIHTCARKLVTTFGPDVVQRSGYRQALVEASIVTNAALAAYSIQEGVGANDAAGLQAVYGVYLLETREVWAPRPGDTKTVGLAAAPHDLAGFVDLGDAVVQSDRIANLLG
jgi:carbonic anhydrase